VYRVPQHVPRSHLYSPCTHVRHVDYEHYLRRCSRLQRQQ
jgi:hypothetical protein